MQCGSDVDFESMLNAAVGPRSAAVQDEEAVGDEDSDSNGSDKDDSDEDESADDESKDNEEPATSLSFVKAAKLKYRELLEKARKHPGAEKRLKAAFVQHGADRMEEYIHDGATDNRRVRAIRDSHQELTQFVSCFGFIWLVKANNYLTSQLSCTTALGSQLQALLLAHQPCIPNLCKNYAFLGLMKR